MRSSLLRFSNTGTGKNTAVYLLAGQALLMGIFYGSFDITAHSMFLSIFDEKMMARAYILSGITGLMLLLLYSKLSDTIRFSRLALANLLFISIVTLLLWILLIFNPAGWAVFLVFIMMGPLNILVIPTFAGTSERMMQKTSGLPLSHKTDTGIILGILTAGFSFPFLISTGIELKHFLLLSFLAVLSALFLQIYAGRKFLFDHDLVQRSDGDSKQRKSVFINPAGDRYISMITVFIILSVITSFFIQYSFLAVTRIQYPAAEDMAHFLGLFTGFMMIFTLILTFPVFPYLIRNFRLRATISIPPLIIAGLTTAVLVTGFMTGTSNAASGITLFFILLALSRFFSGSFRESMESPSASILLRARGRNPEITPDPVMKGVLFGTGIILSGLILTGLGIPFFIKLIHFPLVLVIITLIWVIIAFRLYSKYSKIIRKSSEPAGSKEITTERGDDYMIPGNRIMAEMEFAGDFINLITGDISILQKNHNQWYIEKILDHAEIRKEINLLPALKKIRSDSDIPRETRMRASGIIQDLELLASGLRQNGGKLRAMIILAGERIPPVSEVLKLIRESDDDLKVIALGIIRKFRMNELLPEVCGCLLNSGIEVHAENVLKSFRGDADQALRRFYLVSSENPVMSRTILRVLGKNCSSENAEFLFSLLRTGTRSTRETALRSLTSCNFTINTDEKDILLRLISDVTGIITWNLSAGITIARIGSRILNDAMIEENRRWTTFLFNLLSVAYGEKPVNVIRENMERGTLQSLSHALEIIGILCDEQVQARLSVLFGRTPVRRKLRALFRFYPGEIPEYENIASTVINRDYNLLGVWVRACMIRNIPKITGNEMAESLVALLFSPELILRQETAKLLARSGSEFYRQASDRIPEEMKRTIESIIDGSVKECELQYNKVIFIKSLLNRLPEENLLSLAAELRYTDLLLPENLPVESGYILWECDSRINECRGRIFYDNILRGLSLKEDDTFCYILPLSVLTEYLKRYPEHSREIFTYLDERRNQ